MGKTEDEEEELDRETVGRLVSLNTIIVVVYVIRSTLVSCMENQFRWMGG